MPSTLGQPSGPSGVFVVDSLILDCSVRPSPLSDSLWTYVSFRVRYHFEGCTGSINMLVITVPEYERVIVNLDSARPDSFGVQRTLSQGLWIRSELAEQDSIHVVYSLHGAFWTLDRVVPYDNDFFGMDGEQTLPIKRSQLAA